MQSQLIEGKVVIYGQIVQFLHTRTGRFLASDIFDAGVAGSHSLRLDKTGSKRCWFKIMPHGRGEEGDKVFLENWRNFWYFLTLG